MAIKFFGKLDENRAGRRVSEYPAWYFDVHIEELKEAIARGKRSLNRGEVPPDQVAVVKAEIERDEQKMNEIEHYQPQLSVGEREKLMKLYKEELCPMISASLFTRNQMQKGLAPAHEEAKRMVQPVIEVKSELLGELLVAAGGKLENKKTSRNALAKVFKLVGKLLNEPTNIEVLRIDQ
jgi:hypothetical protein